VIAPGRGLRVSPCTEPPYSAYFWALPGRESALAPLLGVKRKTEAGWGAKICPTQEIPKSTKGKGADGRLINLTNMAKCATPCSVQR
jgi:hypothetical protein